MYIRQALLLALCVSMVCAAAPKARLRPNLAATREKMKERPLDESFFNKYDVNSDNVLDESETAEAIQGLRERFELPKELDQKMMLRAVCDGDGRARL